MYYVYVYLNPLKRGSFSYSEFEFEFEFEPFYVGKGTRNRSTIHDRLFRQGKLQRERNTQKYDTLKKIYESGNVPIIRKIIVNLSNDEACEKERKMIQTIGKRCENKGPLSNLTNGGDGGDVWKNHPNVEEYKKKMSAAVSGEKNGMYGREKSFYPSHKSALTGNHWNSKPWSEERKKQMKRYKPEDWSATAKKVIVYENDLEIGTFLSIKSACKSLNLSYGYLLNSWDKKKNPTETQFKQYKLRIC